MALLIDPPRFAAHGRRWSHLVSDVSFTELHAFAAALGLNRRMFEGDHYDIPEERYHQVVAAGAVPVDSRELLRRLRAAGLRRPKRRGETVLASHDLADGGRLDTVLSRLPAAASPAQPDHLLVVWHAVRLLVHVTENEVQLPRTPWRPVADGAAVSAVGPLGLVVRRGPRGVIRTVQEVLLVESRDGARPPWPELDGAVWRPVDGVVAALPSWLAPLVARLDG